MTVSRFVTTSFYRLSTGTLILVWVTGTLLTGFDGFESALEGPTGLYNGAETILASGKGYPWMNFEDGFVLPSLARGPKEFLDALTEGVAIPRTMVTGDFDEDGEIDLIEGFGTATGGFISVLTTLESATLVSDVSDESNMTRPTLFNLEIDPEFLGYGDFNADGFEDIVAASRVVRRLMWIEGNGQGGFGRPQMVFLPGRITALSTGDVNRRDMLTDVVVGVESDATPLSFEGSAIDFSDALASHDHKEGFSKLLVFENPAGAFAGDPEVIPLAEPAVSIQIGRMDEDIYGDVSIVGSHSLTLVRGRERYFSTAGKRGGYDGVAETSTLALEEEPVAMVLGDFIGDTKRELAIVSASGHVSVLIPGTQQLISTPISIPGIRSDQKLAARRASVSSLPKDDLLVLDSQGKRLHVIHSPAFVGEGYPVEAARPEQTFLQQSLAQTYFDLSMAAAAFETETLNSDGSADIALFGSRTNPDGSRVPLTSVALTQPVFSFVVNTDGSGADINKGDGLCATFQGDCTLRAAIQEGNSTAGADLITFAISELLISSITPVTRQITIDGTSQGKVFLSNNAGALTISGDAGSSVVRNLIIRRSLVLQSIDGGTRVEGCYIGTDKTGSTVPVNWGGHRLGVTSPNNRIGGLTEDRRNIIMGIDIRSEGNIVAGNYVGVNAAGTDKLRPVDNSFLLPNSGVWIRLNGGNNFIGGGDSRTRNVISGFDWYGIYLDRDLGGNSIASNIIGLDAFGTIAIPNGKSGVYVNESDGNIFGTPVVDTGNVVSGNIEDGISINRSNNTKLGNNLIGLDPTGRNPMGNGIYGIDISTSVDTRVGLGIGDGGNTISGNGSHGINVQGSPVTWIYNNHIGTDITGTGPAGNGGSGIKVGSETIIGGSDLQEQNVIGSNAGHGIEAGGTVGIFGNFIGTDRSGTLDLGNQMDGINLIGSDHVVGGVDSNLANTIAYNVGSGVSMRNPVAVLGNSIFRNGRLGIDRTISSNEDDFGVDLSLSYRPVLTKLEGGRVRIELMGLSNADFRVELFGNDECDPSGYGEGLVFLDYEILTTDGAGQADFIRDLQAIAGQEIITATTSDPEGATSEFSACAEVEVIPLIQVQVMEDSLSRNSKPIPDTEFLVGKVDLSVTDNPFGELESMTTDENGMLFLDPGKYAPGDPVYIKTPSESVPADKLLHDAVDNTLYERAVDNLVFNASGNIKAALLDLNETEITRTYMGHATFGFNFVLTFEWPVNTGFLQAWSKVLTNASNLLYDVTNGHAYLNKIAIYDKREVWRHADVQIFAQNTMQPKARVGGSLLLPTPSTLLFDDGDASIVIPPVNFDGTPSDNIKDMYGEPLDPLISSNVIGLMHELGHYLFGFFDEYEDNSGATVWPTINFGIMDDEPANDLSSEMSAVATDMYMDTEQYQKFQTTNWLQFRNTFSTFIRGVPAIAHLPQDWYLSDTEHMAGPNADLSAPDLDVGSMMTFNTQVSLEGLPRTAFLLLDATVEPETPIPGANVRLLRRIMDGAQFQGWDILDQGKTIDSGVNTGGIRAFDYEIGDEIIANSSGKNWKFYFDDPSISGKGANHEVVIRLQSPSGNNTFISSLRFDAGGQLQHVVYSSLPFSSPPTVELLDGSVSIPVEHKAEGDLLVAQAPVGLSTGITLLLTAPDADGQPFPVPEDVTLFLIDAGTENLYSSVANLEITLNPNTTDIEQLVVLSSDFPTPPIGLPDSVRQVSRSHSFEGFPLSVAPSGRIQIGFNTDSLRADVSEAITVFKWDQDQWVSIPTTSNIEKSTASIEFKDYGVYAAFLDLRKATVVNVQRSDEKALPSLVLLHQNYPNPFNPSTTIEYSLATPENVNIIVYDLLGRKVKTLVNEWHGIGEYRIQFDARHLPSGVYFYELSAGRFTETRSMLVLK